MLIELVHFFKLRHKLAENIIVFQISVDSVHFHAGTRRNKFTDDNVLFKTKEVINLASDRGVG